VSIVSRSGSPGLRDSFEDGVLALGVGQSERPAMTRKEIAVEFVIPTAFAVAVGLVLGLLLSASLLSG
jgi:hypothetical protein